MMTLTMPSNYKIIENDEAMEYVGGSTTLIIALYKVVSFVVTKWDLLSAGASFASSAASLISMIQSWRQKNGTYKLQATWVPGGNSNIYPPHSYQGATGYWTYSSIWVRNS